ncbi:MAG: GtrA family protein [Candidatus Absconditicoccaceae bacterium]
MKRLIKKLYNYKFIRYSLGGGLAALLDLGLLYIFTDIFGIYYLYSAILAFIVSVSFAYFFQKYITFRNYSQKHLLQGSLFLGFQLVGQSLYMLFLRIGVDIMYIHYMFVAILAKGVVFLRNYIANYYFNFKN